MAEAKAAKAGNKAKVAGAKAKAAAAKVKAAGRKAAGAAEQKAAGVARAAMQAMKIRLLVKENPKRPGTEAHARFALYKNGMTVADFLEQAKAKGNTHPSSDIRYGVKHKFLELY